jgi:rare lipoprotein A (peptidoglycan hydrolase)
MKPVVAKEPDFIEGEASYYSREGCLGCSENLTMANGQPLDDTMRTVALTPEIVRARKLLNKTVTIINSANGKQTTAKVTDTGGFGKYNRVADLSVATKDAIGCASLCQVTIQFN